MTRQISFAVALNEALKEEMRRDPAIFVAGEDVGKMGGLFKVTQDLLEEFGPSRVLDTPISEAAIAGLGVGGALVGARPIIEFQFADFVTIAMDQVINHAAKLRYMTGGILSVPLVIRAPVCGGVGLGAQHSQSLEAWFVHVPGIKVVMPATPGDAKGLLKSAIRDDNPVLFLEHRKLYAATGEVPSEEYVVPLGMAEVKREGSDVTVVCTGRTVSLALAAAERLSEQDMSIEVIDLRTLKPFDLQTVSNSVRKTNRAVVVNDGWRICGYAAEIVASIQDECFYDLDNPIQRVCNKDAPMAAATHLERSLMVSEQQIVAACRAAMSL